MSAISQINDDDVLLNKTLSIRNVVIDQLFKDNKIPNDKEDRELLFRAMEGMDKTILARAKNKIDKEANTDVKEMNAIALAILEKTRPAHIKQGVEAPTLPSDIKVTNPIPGETDVGTVNLTYETFKKTN